MLKQWTKKYHQFKAIAGVQLHFSDSDRPFIYYTLLVRKGQEVNIQESGQAISLDDLWTKIPKHTPVALTITGKGILHKAIEMLPENPENSLSLALPNAQAEDFVFQTFSAIEKNWVSIFRKASVNTQIEAFETAGLPIVQFNLGIFPMQAVLSVLGVQSGGIVVGHHILQIAVNSVFSFINNNEITEETYEVANYSLKAVELLSFASAFQVFVGQKTRVYQLPELAQAIQNIAYRRIVQVAGWSFMLLLFGFLLINFLAFNWLTDTTRQQQVELNYHQRQLQQLDALRSAYEEQQAFLKQNNILKASKTSLYADGIAASLPEGLELTDLAIFPNKANRREQRENLFRFANGTIQIKGLSRRSTILNNWIKTLEQISWVDQVNVLPYSEKEGGVGEFELEIGLVDDKK